MTLSSHGNPTHETFYFLPSLPSDRLSPQQWLTLVRRHWAVETTHQILDGRAFEEDDRPWVSQNPRLITLIMILRRMDYTLLAIFKHVTQRSDARRDEPKCTSAASCTSTRRSTARARARERAKRAVNRGTSWSPGLATQCFQPPSPSSRDFVSARSHHS